jgi:hypothetical protein
MEIMHSYLQSLLLNLLLHCLLPFDTVLNHHIFALTGVNGCVSSIYHIRCRFLNFNFLLCLIRIFVIVEIMDCSISRCVKIRNRSLRPEGKMSFPQILLCLESLLCLLTVGTFVIKVNFHCCLSRELIALTDLNMCLLARMLSILCFDFNIPVLIKFIYNFLASEII